MIRKESNAKQVGDYDFDVSACLFIFEQFRNFGRQRLLLDTWFVNGVLSTDVIPILSFVEHINSRFVLTIFAVGQLAIINPRMDADDLIWDETDSISSEFFCTKNEELLTTDKEYGTFGDCQEIGE